MKDNRASSKKPPQSWTQRNKKILRASVAAATIGLPTQAQAKTIPEIGAFAGYRWGGASSGFEWGVETGFHLIAEKIINVVGGNLQLSVQGTSAPILAASITGGSLPLGGEVGIAYRFGEASGFGLHFGLYAQLLGNVAIRYKPGLDDLSLTAGVRFPSGIWPILAAGGMHGRPLRTPTGIAGQADITTEETQSTQRYYPNQCPNALQALWLTKAQAEWLSVPAFAQLAEQLSALQAPQALISQTLSAKQDEIHHAILTAGIASMASGSAVSISEPEQEYRPVLHGQDGLIRLAVESWLDGCLHEGLAAREVQLQAEQATEPTMQEALVRIAADEANHHELGWAIMQWAVEQGGDEIKQALQAVQQSVPPWEEVSPESNEELEGFGALSPTQRSQLYEAHTTASRQRLTALLQAA